jgi:hypothetical protein
MIAPSKLRAAEGLIGAANAANARGTPTYSSRFFLDGI